MKKHVLLAAVVFLFISLPGHGQDINGTWSISIQWGNSCTWTGTLDLESPTNPGDFTGDVELTGLQGGSCGNRSGSVDGGIFGNSLNLVLPVGHPSAFQLSGTYSERNFVSGSWTSADGRSGSWHARCTSCFTPIPAIPFPGLLALALLVLVTAALRLRRQGPG